MDKTEKLHVPEMDTIQNAADRTGLSYMCLWRACKAGKITYIKSGSRYYINMDKLAEMLNNGEV